MPTEVKGAIQLRKALREFAPGLAKETQKEIGALLRPVVAKAKGFIPNTAPLSGWGEPAVTGKFPRYNASEAKRGIGYKTTPSKPNRKGFRSLARIQNASAAGAIYETAGRVNPNGRDQAKRREVNIPGMNSVYTTSTGKNYGKSNNPEAGSLFVQAMNQEGQIVDAYSRSPGASGRSSRKMKGRVIFRAWAEDGGKTNAAVIKAIENSAIKFNKTVAKGNGHSIAWMGKI
jgi:hypothetical protein